MPDELFSPTIQERPSAGKPPWQPESLVYPAFFGGALAAATLGVLNGRRLGLSRGQLLLIAAAGLASVVGRLVVVDHLDADQGIRFSGTVAGVLVWLVVMAFQRKPFRVFSYRGGEAAGLVGPGFAAAIGCGLLEVVLILVLVR